MVFQNKPSHRVPIQHLDGWSSTDSPMYYCSQNRYQSAEIQQFTYKEIAENQSPASR